MSSRSIFRGPPVPWPGNFVNPFAMADQMMHQMQQEMDRWFGGPQHHRGANGVPSTSFYRPFVDAEHPTDTELYRLMNPIVEENGVKKFKLEFDVRRFKPEDVKITTNEQKRCLTIEAKKQDENSKFEYFRKITIPDGIKPNEITCNFRSDGVLAFEAPYYEPAKIETRPDTKIEIEHK
uniref:SHSP domain-containing protein n=1 Tax=Acrobeloides nanus TaxID=290746 RepID=A0A914E595_9BILA